MTLSAIIIYNILKYVCEILYLQLLIYLYKQTLDQTNITYIVKIIKQKEFKNLDILVPQAESILDIPKIMIIMNKNKYGFKMIEYF